MKSPPTSSDVFGPSGHVEDFRPPSDHETFGTSSAWMCVFLRGCGTAAPRRGTAVPPVLSFITSPTRTGRWPLCDACLLCPRYLQTRCCPPPTSHPPAHLSPRSAEHKPSVTPGVITAGHNFRDNLETIYLVLSIRMETRCSADYSSNKLALFPIKLITSFFLNTRLSALTWRFNSNNDCVL